MNLLGNFLASNMAAVIDGADLGRTMSYVDGK